MIQKVKASFTLLPVFSAAAKYICVFLVFFGLSFAASAADTPRPLISIIIDDMGNHAERDLEIINLPGAVTCSIMPYSFYGVWIANKAHAAQKEIILHVPMQAIGGEYLGKGGLSMQLTRAQFDRALDNDLSSIPYIEGLNNHMGSLLTQQPKQMGWLMQFIKPTGLFYVDSRTTPHTVAEKIADLDAVPAIQRNIFLDDVPTTMAISTQFSYLIAIARVHGMAVAIGHPYPATIAFLQQELPKLQQQGIQLVPLSQLVADREYVLHMPGVYLVRNLL